MGNLNKFFTWFSNLAYLNFLWIVFSLMGFVVIGIAPSTAALFAVIRKLMQSEEKVPITKTYFYYFRKDFLKINYLFYVLVLIFLILYLNVSFLYQLKNGISNVFLFLTLILMVFFIITIVFIFPVYVQYNLKITGYIRQAFLLGVINPLYFLVILTGLIFTYGILIYFGTLLFFFGISLGAYIIMYFSLIIFQKLKTD